MSTLFVAGSHTDVGKTHVACAMLRAARAAGRRVDAFKPVMSGYDPQRPAESDAGRLLAAQGVPLTESAMDAIAPLRFTTPLAPPLAARREGVRLTLDDLLRSARLWASRPGGGVRLLEGAGGVMSPVAEDATNLDLMAALGFPVLLIGGDYLGSVSHTLSALEVIRRRHVPLRALVISGSAEPASPDLSDTVELVRRFAGDAPVFAAPRDSHAAWAADLLTAVAPLTLPSG